MDFDVNSFMFGRRVKIVNHHDKTKISKEGVLSAFYIDDKFGEIWVVDADNGDKIEAFEYEFVFKT